jgi:hypothetical protein
VDFDQNDPPAQNSSFTIHLVDVVENQAQSSVITYLNAEQVPLYIRAGDNLSVNPNAAIQINEGPNGIGINPLSTNDGSNVLASSSYSKYGHSISLLYILDEDTDDRLIIRSMVGMEFFA